MLIVCFSLHSYWKKERGFGIKSNYYENDMEREAKDHQKFASTIIMILLAEHILSYLFGLFRNWEIKKKGKPNKYGIESAPIEFRLRCLELLADLIIFIFILNHFTDLTSE